MGFGFCSPILFDVSVRKHKWVLKVYTGCIDKRNERCEGNDDLYANKLSLFFISSLTPIIG